MCFTTPLPSQSPAPSFRLSCRRCPRRPPCRTATTWCWLATESGFSKPFGQPPSDEPAVSRWPGGRPLLSRLASAPLAGSHLPPCCAQAASCMLAAKAPRFYQHSTIAIRLLPTFRFHLTGRRQRERTARQPALPQAPNDCTHILSLRLLGQRLHCTLRAHWRATILRRCSTCPLLLFTCTAYPLSHPGVYGPPPTLAPESPTLASFGPLAPTRRSGTVCQCQNLAEGAALLFTGCGALGCCNIVAKR